MLATNPIDFLRKKFKNESCAVVFSSYWTKHESPAGDQIWKFSRQCSIFGRIGDQWVAISSPGVTMFVNLLETQHAVIIFECVGNVS